jgi:hypothetical protein
VLGPAGISGRCRAEPEAGAATAKTGQGHRAAGGTGRDSLCLRVPRQKHQAACRSSRRTRAVPPQLGAPRSVCTHAMASARDNSPNRGEGPWPAFTGK